MWIGFSRKKNAYWFLLIPIFMWYLPSLLFVHIRMGFAFALLIIIVSLKRRINFFYIFCLCLIHYSVVIIIFIDFIIKANKGKIFLYCTFFSIILIIFYENADLLTYDILRVYFYEKEFNFNLIVPIILLIFFMLMLIDPGINRVVLLLFITFCIKFLAGDELSGRLSSAFLMLTFIKISYLGIIGKNIDYKFTCLKMKHL